MVDSVGLGSSVNSALQGLQPIKRTTDSVQVCESEIRSTERRIFSRPRDLRTVPRIWRR